MAPLSGARLERYLQNGAVIRPLGLPDHHRRCVWRRQCAVWAISGSRRRQPRSRCRQPRSRRWRVSCDLANVNKRKLRTFDWPLGLPGHRRRDFDVGAVSYCQKMTVRVRDNCRWSWSMSQPSPFHNFAENPQFCTLFSPSILRNSISHFALCQHPSPRSWHLHI